MKYFKIILRIIKYSYICTMAKKKSKSGRKPVEPSEKVKLVGFYTKQKFIDKVGGIEKARQMAKDFIETNYQILV